jgi:hypothetical protein
MATVRAFIDGQFQDDELEPVGIGGFTTAARIKNKITKTRDVPSTYLEDGSFVNDHIIRNPSNISIDGEISNVFQLPSPTIKALLDAQANIGVIAQYAPERTQTQIQKVNSLAVGLLNTVDQVDAVIADSQRFAQYLGFTGSEGKTNIEKFIDFMDSIHNTDVLISIDAPFRTYENMAITSFIHEQNAESESLSFTIEAQELRFAQTIFSEINSAKNPARNTNGQTQGVTDKGIQDGKEQTESFVTASLRRFSQ